MAYMTSFVPADLLEDHEETHPPSTSPNYVFSSCPPQDFHGVSPLLMRRSMSFSGVERYHEQGGLQGDDDMSDDGSQLLLGEKKKRLNMEQVRALEKSFELGNKLEPERKTQLARALGLQPRQIAIWFQNRRARWKTKQLEKDYDLLRRQFEALKADNDSLRAHNKKLLSELMVLKGRESTTGSGVVINLNKETKGIWSNGNEKSCDVGIGGTRTAATDSPLYSNPSNRHIMPSPVEPASSSSVAQFLLQSQKIDQMVPDESLSNMFINGIEDRPGFWAWSEQQQFR